MKKIKCVIADDELLTLELLESYILKLENYELVARCRNGLEVFNFLKSESCDLLFLDIQMPQLTGIELVKRVSKLPAVVFTTAFREYALDGYELNVLDYLLKPISFDRFLKTIDKFEHGSSLRVEKFQKNAERDMSKGTPFIYIKSGKKTVKVFLKDIVFIEGAKQFVKVRTVSGDIISYQSLVDFEQRLPDASFLRIHRSYIIAVDRIRSYTATSVEVDDAELPIGQSYQRIVAEALKL